MIDKAVAAQSEMPVDQRIRLACLEYSNSSLPMRSKGPAEILARAKIFEDYVKTGTIQ